MGGWIDEMDGWIEKMDGWVDIEMDDEWRD